MGPFPFLLCSGLPDDCNFVSTNFNQGLHKNKHNYIILLAKKIPFAKGDLTPPPKSNLLFPAIPFPEWEECVRSLNINIRVNVNKNGNV